MISIDLADFDTDLEQVQKLVEETFTEEEQNAFYDLNLYLVEQKDVIPDEHIETLVESDLPGVNNGPVDSVEGFKNILDESQKDTDLSEEEQKTEKAFVTMLRYVFKNENKKEAVEQQELAISNNWNIKFKIHVDAIFE